MGSKITAKYAGMCKVCGSDWKIGEQIYYSKTPKAICVEEECFNEQGGQVSKSFSSNFTSTQYKKRNLRFVVPDVEVPDGVKVAAEMLLQVLVVAHSLTKSSYPDLDEEDDVFGQIRSKFCDQLLTICLSIPKD